jgi:hypothetical protein
LKVRFPEELLGQSLVQERKRVALSEDWVEAARIEVVDLVVMTAILKSLRDLLEDGVGELGRVVMRVDDKHLHPITSDRSPCKERLPRRSLAELWPSCWPSGLPVIGEAGFEPATARPPAGGHWCHMRPAASLASHASLAQDASDT